MRRLSYNKFILAISVIAMLLFIQAFNINFGQFPNFYYAVKEQWIPPLQSQTTEHNAVTTPQNMLLLYQMNWTSPRNRETLDKAGSKFISDLMNAQQSGRSPPLWQRELLNRTLSGQRAKKMFYLTHLLMVRLYHKDLAEWTLRELKQWMHYMFLIGIEHIYICDHWHPGDDNMEQQLQHYINLSLVTYSRTDIHEPMTAQVHCYREWVDKEGWKSEWMTSVDMDEYPYHLEDKEETCLSRYLKNISIEKSHVVEILMDNFLMLGQGDRSKNITVDRIRRITPKPANSLVKPIFKPKFVTPKIHGGVLRNGSRETASHKHLRMLHYWGARLQNWGPDTEKIKKMTVTYDDMAEVWAEKIRNSLLCFGEWDAFSTESGP